MNPRRNRFPQCLGQVLIADRRGLDLRVATRTALVAMEFHATVILRNRHDETADARNILGLLLLGARHGDRVHLRSLGYDATEAMTAIAAVLSR